MRRVAPSKGGTDYDIRDECLAEHWIATPAT